MSAYPDARTVSVLFVDDFEPNFTLIRQRLERAFRRHGCTAILLYEQDPDLAYDKISTGQPFDVVIADLLFRPPDRPDAPLSEHEPRGLEIIEHARHTSANTVIVALTLGTSNRPELEQHARDRDADIVLLRGNLMDDSDYGGTKRLVKDIHALLCERELLEVGPSLQLGDEPGIQAALHEIRPATFRLLLTDLVPVPESELRSAELTYLTPGASGAHVLCAVVSLADGSTRRLLVKASRDQKALAREVANSRNLFGLYDSFLVVRYQPIDESTRPRNGWSAIAMEFADNAATIRDWLSEESSAPHVPAVFRQLFLNRGLASRYREHLTVPEDVRPIDRLRLPPFRRVLVSAAVERLAPVLDHPDGGNVSNAGEILRKVAEFSRVGRIGAVPAADTPGDLILVNAHGDLHGANVLICDGEHPRPLIIDFAAFGAHHWTADPARLMVDAVLRSMDNTVESFLWRRLSAWRQIMADASNLDGSVGDDLPKNNSVITALRWMAEEHLRLLPQLESKNRWWEWHVALAEQLLRGTYQPDLPPAKRTLALLAAYDQLTLAEAKMPPRTPSF